jgi:hypothetical protein
VEVIINILEGLVFLGIMGTISVSILVAFMTLLDVMTGYKVSKPVGIYSLIVGLVILILGTYGIGTKI